MRYGVILAILLIGVAGGVLANMYEKLEEDSYTAARIEMMAEEQIEVVAGDDSSSTSAVGLEPDTEQIEGFHNMGARKYDFLDGPFGYVQAALGCAVAAGVIYIIKARLAGASGA